MMEGSASRGVPPEEAPSAADAFGKRLLTALSAGANQHQAARWLEEWQEFELENGILGATQAAIHVIQDPRFAPLVESGVKSLRRAKGGEAAAFLRNGAGLFFRLHAFYMNDSLTLSSAFCAPILLAYHAIFESLERPDANLAGAFLGAFYTQSLAAWATVQMGDSDARGAVAQTVRRAGLVVVKLLGADEQRRDEARRAIEVSYLQCSHEAVWGGRDKDVVWCELFSS